MTWSWSHTEEAYENARINLANLPLETLQDIYCEIKTYFYCVREEGEHHWLEAPTPDRYYDKNKFSEEKSKVSDDRSSLVSFIWMFAQQWRLCDNGGHLIHLCSFGCDRHKVSVDSQEEHYDCFVEWNRHMEDYYL